jgi:hypothetical protein
MADDMVTFVGFPPAKQCVDMYSTENMPCMRSFVSFDAEVLFALMTVA